MPNKTESYEQQSKVKLNKPANSTGKRGLFSNLLSNALKYLDQHRKGVIHISGWTDDSTATYCVEDNGIGIPANQINKVFELFHQVDSKSSASGEGLGLATVKQIVDRHTGKVWVESELDKGSKFFVSLPSKENVWQQDVLLAEERK